MISLVLDQPKEMKDAMGNLQTEIKRLEDMKHDLGEKLDSIATRLHDEYDIGWYEMDNYRGSRTPTVYRENIIKEKGEEAAALLDEWRNLSNQSEKFSDELSNKKQDMQEIVDTFDFPQQQQKHGQPTNTLAHIRLTDRNIDGRKVLFVEEIQSDWHQAAQKKEKRTLPSGEVVEEKVGYRDLRKEKALVEKHQALQRERFEIEKQLGYHDDLLESPPPERANLTQEQADKFFARIDEIERQLDSLETDNFFAANRPFFGPFSNTSEWSELALKKVLQEAVDGGYDQVALVTGQQAVDVVGGKASGMQGFYDLVTPSGKTGVLPATLKDYAKKLGVKLEMEQSNILGTKPEQAKQLADYRLGQLSGQTQGQVLPPSYVPDFIDAIPEAIEHARMRGAGAEAVVSRALDQSGASGVAASGGDMTIYKNLVELYRPAIEGALSGNMNAYNNIVFKITPDVKSAVGKGQRLWSAGASIGPAMELLRQRQGLPPKKEEKKKK
jgi:hypothetical protein